MIPAYLEPIKDADYYYGTLSYDQSKNSWMIKAEPCVTVMAKRLFPGSSGRGRGEANFPNTKRTVGDLNWLMQRYPLHVERLDLWEKAYHDSVEYVVKRNAFLANPPKAVQPLGFNGILKEFQKEGLAYLEHNRRTLLADEMGLGKTVQALAFLASSMDYPALIVVQPHLVRQWPKMISGKDGDEGFLKIPGNGGQDSLFNINANDAIHVIHGLRPYDLPAASVYIIHYLLLRSWKDILPECGFKTVIFDEIQELRHTGTQKYSAASLVAGSASNVIGLSGTPIYNHGGEIWNVLNIIDYHCLGDWDSFTREWCSGYGSDIVTDPDLLGDYLKREGLLLRRTKKQVASELPPKRRVTVSIDFDEGIYSKMVQNAVVKAKEITSISNFLERGRMKRDIIDDTRHAIGVAKAPYVAAFVKMLLDAGEKVILSAYHHDVWDIYQDELAAYHPVFITGRESQAEKDRSVEAFRTGKSNLCCLSLRTGSGIDGLQCATVVVFGELDWSPAVHSQIEDRLQRFGVDESMDSILCYYLVAEAGTDEAIQEVLGLKVSQFVGIMGDEFETEEDKAIAQTVASEHMDRVVEKLRARCA